MIGVVSAADNSEVLGEDVDDDSDTLEIESDDSSLKTTDDVSDTLAAEANEETIGITNDDVLSYEEDSGPFKEPPGNIEYQSDKNITFSVPYKANGALNVYHKYARIPQLLKLGMNCTMGCTIFFN